MNGGWSFMRIRILVLSVLAFAVPAPALAETPDPAKAAKPPGVNKKPVGILVLQPPPSYWAAIHTNAQETAARPKP